VIRSTSCLVLRWGFRGRPFYPTVCAHCHYREVTTCSPTNRLLFEGLHFDRLAINDHKEFLASVVGVNIATSVVVDTRVVCQSNCASSATVGLVRPRTAATGSADVWASRRLEDWKRRDGERYRLDAARVDDRRNTGRRGGSGGGRTRREDAAERRRDGGPRRGTSPGDDCLVELLQQPVHRSSFIITTIPAAAAAAAMPKSLSTKPLLSGHATRIIAAGDVTNSTDHESSDRSDWSADLPSHRDSCALCCVRWLLNFHDFSCWRF